MKFCRFNDDRYGVIRDGRIHDITSIVDDVLAGQMAPRWGDPIIAHLSKIRTVVEKLELRPTLSLEEATLLSPSRHPSKIIAAPTNYHTLVAEMEAKSPGQSTGKGVADSGLFLKANSALVGTGEGVRIRFPDRTTEHEIEFVVVIGKNGSQIQEADALNYVAGYSIGLDMTVRGHEERSIRKSIDTYAVVGPWLVTKDEIADPNDFGYRLSVNGQLRQDERTSNMVVSCEKLIALASQFYTLYPGDIIFTGAGAGSGPVKPGDVMTAECGVLGPFSVQCLADGDALE